MGLWDLEVQGFRTQGSIGHGEFKALIGAKCILVQGSKGAMCLLIQLSEVQGGGGLKVL